jgi:hypothetical protein
MDFTDLIDAIVTDQLPEDTHLEPLAPLPDPLHPDSAVRTKRMKRMNEQASSYADQLIARVAVDTGAVSLVEGVLHIRDVGQVEPSTMERIAEYMPEVLRSVGQLARAKEYGEVYRQAATDSEAA